MTALTRYLFPFPQLPTPSQPPPIAILVEASLARHEASRAS